MHGELPVHVCMVNNGIVIIHHTMRVQCIQLILCKAEILGTDMSPSLILCIYVQCQ